MPKTSSALNSSTAPNCNVTADWYAKVNTALRAANYTPQGIADRINESLKVTSKVVDGELLLKWCSPSQEETIPPQYLSALCWALTSPDPLEILLKPIQYGMHCKLQVMEKRLAEKQQEVDEIQSVLHEMATGG